MYHMYISKLTQSWWLFSNQYCLWIPLVMRIICLVYWKLLEPSGNNHPMTKLSTAAVCEMDDRNYSKLVCLYSLLSWIVCHRLTCRLVLFLYLELELMTSVVWWIWGARKWLPPDTTPVSQSITHGGHNLI